MNEIIKKMLESLFEKFKEDTSNWIQVGKLDKEDMGRHRSESARMEESAAEAEMHKAKIASLLADADARGKEWWFYIQKKYGTPPVSQLHVGKDGIILMKPKSDDD